MNTTNILNNTNLISTAIDLLQQQAPDVASQCINGGICNAVFTIFCGLMFIIGSWLLCKHLHKNALNDKYSEDFREVGVPLIYIISGVIVTFSLIVIVSETSTLISIFVAPKVYVLKQILHSFK
jgi:heme O synthase-like polyprenyltransferase